jgi:hypothetical protein
MPASSSFDHLFGDSDGLLGSVFLDSALQKMQLLRYIAWPLHRVSLISPRRLMVTVGRKRSANLIRPFIIGRALPTSQLI